MKSRSSALARPAGPRGPAARLAAYGRIARSFVFFAVAMLYLALPLGLMQRLFFAPLLFLLPRRRPRLLRGWFHFHASTMMRLARVFAGLRLRVHGRIAPGPCVVVMNHQSILDIPVIHTIGPDPVVLIPTRTRYARGIPGISPLVRLARYPLVTQRRESVAADLAEMERGAAMAATGDYSLCVFPEGHRTRDGEIGPFMVRGLVRILSIVRHPVWCVVGDGMWGARTFAEAAGNMAGARIDCVVLGPFHPPADPADLPQFIQEIRDHMVAALHRLREEAPRGR